MDRDRPPWTVTVTVAVTVGLRMLRNLERTSGVEDFPAVPARMPRETMTQAWGTTGCRGYLGRPGRVAEDDQSESITITITITLVSG